MGKDVYCNKCCGEIEYKSQLVIVQEGIIGVAVYHEGCYARTSKGLIGFIMSKPLDSVQGILTLIVSNIIFITILFMSIKENEFIPLNILILFIAFYSNFHYFLRWYYYTRHLK
ncbi:hypothetical protein [Paramaledivibacter caminithermalis]|jgi:hypothetical protein|uniref:Uncharacterized protein n=1 Tax=Paramaledivibacter caminithermalis (strain DSM 15212 / CIP 107654 / DViRD3) TaxID=1121301 RepID=A0A1M6KQA4_PARC5|nr:hypothetical protein [Paramaledivibacter caminithermalis]SHJ61076.1 hypothetical protein SAMN02745912_00478 [Paramaledivibacter caminithermalis DSM 15212]